MVIRLGCREFIQHSSSRIEVIINSGSKLSRVNVVSGLGVVLALILLCGCSATRISRGESSLTLPRLRVEKVSELQLRHVNSVVVATPVVELGIAGVTAAQFQRQLLRTLEGELGVAVTEQRVPAERGLKRAEALRSALRAGIDAVVFADLTRYVESSGTSVGADAPAEVSFLLEVVHAKTGETVWRASYVAKDRALTENLFEIERAVQGGAVWRSAAQLLEQGVREAARGLATQRSAQFVS